MADINVLRRNLLKAASIITLPLSRPAWAKYPDKTIRLIVPLAVGDNGDTLIQGMTTSRSLLVLIFFDSLSIKRKTPARRARDQDISRPIKLKTLRIEGRKPWHIFNIDGIRHCCTKG